MKLKRDKISKLKKLPAMPKSYLNYINSVRRKAKKHKIEVFFSKDKVVFDDNKDMVGCGGFFSEELQRLATSTNKPLTHWFPVFIHESCHMDQWIENKEFWDNKMEDYTKFFEWLAFDIELTPKELERSRRAIIEIEQDCEKRAVEKIKFYKFPNILLKDYIQKANCYLFLYTFMMKRRKWYNNVYNKVACWKACPIKFPKDYKKISKKLLNAFTEVCDKIEKKEESLLN